MRKKEGIIVDVFEPGELRTLHMNMTKKPFDDIRVRKAVAHAISRDEIVAFMGKEVTQPTFTVVPNGYLGHTRRCRRATTTIRKKPRRCSKKPASRTDSPPRRSFRQRPPLLAPMQIIQEQLRRVGITLELDVVEHATFHAQIRKDLSAAGALRGRPLSDRRHVSDPVLSLPQHRRHADGGHQFFAHQGGRCRNRRRPRRGQIRISSWSSGKRPSRRSWTNVSPIPFLELLQVWVRKDNLDYGHDLKAALTLGPIIDETTHFK